MPILQGLQQGRHNRPAGKESFVGQAQAASKDSSANNFTVAVSALHFSHHVGGDTVPSSQHCHEGPPPGKWTSLPRVPSAFSKADIIAPLARNQTWVKLPQKTAATNFTLAVAKHLRLFHVRFTLATFTSLLFDQEENANTSRWFPMCQQSIWTGVYGIKLACFMPLVSGPASCAHMQLLGARRILSRDLWLRMPEKRDEADSESFVWFNFGIPFLREGANKAKLVWDKNGFFTLSMISLDIFIDP